MRAKRNLSWSGPPISRGGVPEPPSYRAQFDDIEGGHTRPNILRSRPISLPASGKQKLPPPCLKWGALARLCDRPPWYSPTARGSRTTALRRSAPARSGPEHAIGRQVDVDTDLGQDRTRIRPGQVHYGPGGRHIFDHHLEVPPLALPQFKPELEISRECLAKEIQYDSNHRLVVQNGLVSPSFRRISASFTFH